MDWQRTRTTIKPRTSRRTWVISGGYSEPLESESVDLDSREACEVVTRSGLALTDDQDMVARLQGFRNRRHCGQIPCLPSEERK